MKVLGISNGYTSSACLVIGEEIVAAVSEERFTRKKMDDCWPEKSIEYVMEEGGLKMEELDHIGYSWYCGENKYPKLYEARFAELEKENSEGVGILKERMLMEHERDKVFLPVVEEFKEKWGDKVPITTFDHHECHAFGAYIPSPFEKALVLTSDGRGDYSAFTASVFTPEGHKILYRATSADSFGFFYGRITALLGFTPHKHEGKVTGLAAHGDPQKLLPVMQKMISVRDGKVICNLSRWYRPFFSNFSEELEEVIKSNSREDVAAAAQLHLENLMVEIADHYLRETGMTHVCLSGGTFANVRVNQKILELPQVENVYIQPHMGDGGLAEGAACAIPYLKEGVRPRARHMFLGPEYGEGIGEGLSTPLRSSRANESVAERRASESRDSAASLEKSLIDEIIDAIEDSKVVGLFRGRMEYGPRALCHRTVLYHCRDKSVNDWLNKRMDRTEFMPFAPVTAEELAPKCYKGWKKEHIASRFMTITYDCTEEMKKDCPAAVHVDGTARPQVISKEDEPFVHELLMKFYERTGGLSLINTSFNMHEEPIVCTPEDAFRCLDLGMVDVLVIGDDLVAARQCLAATRSCSA